MLTSFAMGESMKKPARWGTGKKEEDLHSFAIQDGPSQSHTCRSIGGIWCFFDVYYFSLCHCLRIIWKQHLLKKRKKHGKQAKDIWTFVAKGSLGYLSSLLSHRLKLGRMLWIEFWPLQYEWILHVGPPFRKGSPPLALKFYYNKAPNASEGNILQRRIWRISKKDLDRPLISLVFFSRWCLQKMIAMRNYVAELLAGGPAWTLSRTSSKKAKPIIAVVRGRQEFGPRALGHRSLLAVPDSVEIREAWYWVSGTRWLACCSKRAYSTTVLDGVPKASGTGL